MVNYKLSVKDSKEFHEIIWNISEFSDFNNHRLDQIDLFTSNFETNTLLNEKLIHINALNPKFINHKTSIRYNFRQKDNVVRYGVMLSDDHKFLDCDYIIDYLLKKYDDEVLIEKLCNHYRNSYINVYNVAKLRRYLSILKTSKINADDYSDYRKTIIDFVEREIYQFDTTNYQFLVDEDGTRKISYKSFRSLAMFIANDYKSRVNPSIKEKQDKKIKVYKKNIQIPGQLSLF